MSTEVNGPGKRRGDKRERTRQRLIEAAVQLVGEQGFDGASLDQIARRAGMTRGAFYNNFDSKAELFVCVAQKLWSPIAPDFRQGAPLKENMREMGRAVAAAARERRRIAVGAMSFQVYAMKHDEMRKLILESNAQIYKWAEHQLLQYVSAADLPVPPDRFVRILHALTEGLLTTHFLTPELMTESMIEEAFEALA
jgi:AcrR family transcriptional regulator